MGIKFFMYRGCRIEKHARNVFRVYDDWMNTFIFQTNSYKKAIATIDEICNNPSILNKV